MSIGRNQIARYRKRPVIIDAFQLTDCRYHEKASWPSWLKNALYRGHDKPNSIFIHQRVVHVHTLEGPRLVSVNDYIIRDAIGELWPYKPSIFNSIYELVTEDRL